MSYHPQRSPVETVLSFLESLSPLSPRPPLMDALPEDLPNLDVFI